MRRPSQANTLYFFQIVKEPYSLRLKSPEASKPQQLARFQTLSPLRIGGGERDRTDDLLLAKQALSQLSYGPKNWWVWVDSNHRPHPYQGCALTN